MINIVKFRCSKHGERTFGALRRLDPSDEVEMARSQRRDEGGTLVEAMLHWVEPFTRPQGAEAVEEGMAKAGLSKKEMAWRMRTRRSQLERVLDPACFE